MAMKMLHVVPGLDNPTNGIAVAAKLIAGEQAAEIVGAREFGKVKDLAKYGEVWVHSCWLPATLRACWKVLMAKRLLVRMTHANLDPVRLRYHGWKKWLVGPIERYFLRRCDRIIATCKAEKEWIEAYLGKRCPPIEVTDVKRFFDLGDRSQELGVSEGFSRKERKDRKENEGNGSKQETGNKKLNLLYLGRRHPLKGVAYLEAAVSELNSSNPPLPTPPLLKIVSNAFGDEKEKVWEWCDVLVLPTLSENFGLVVAEALERGKRVITTDGAPVWDPMGSVGVRECGIGGVRMGEGMGEREDSSTSTLNFDSNILVGYGGRLRYLKRFRDGSKETRVELLKKAIGGG